MATRGERRHVVTFEQPGPPVSDGEGGYTETWTPLSPPLWYVSIRPATAKEAAMLGTLITHVSSIVEGDYHPGVTIESRMVLDGEIYQVTSVIDVELRHQRMQLVVDRQS